MPMTNTFHSSGKGHAISGAGKLSSVQRHNERGYFSFEYDSGKIHSLVGDVGSLAADVENYINKKFQSAVDEYNDQQKRNDRKIQKTPFEYFCDNKKLDIANEVILQLGDQDFWSAVRMETVVMKNKRERVLKSFPEEVKKVMNEIFLKQAAAYEKIYETNSEDILKLILRDYEKSKKTMAEFSEHDLAVFSKIEKKKPKERKPLIEILSEKQKEGFERFLSARGTIDFVEDKRLVERIKNKAMTIKLLNLVGHYDEWSPHAHGVSVCSVKGYESGLNERVAKAVVLNKWSLEVIQDKLHEIAKEEMAKHPELFTVPLEEKKKGRNYDYTVAEYKAKREIEKLGEIKTEIKEAQEQLEELSEIKTMAEYQAQVIENDKMISNIKQAVVAATVEAQRQGLSWEGAKAIVNVVLDKLSDIIESLRIKIKRVQLFESLHRIFERAAGKRQENTLEDILSNARARSEGSGAEKDAGIEPEHAQNK